MKSIFLLLTENFPPWLNTAVEDHLNMYVCEHFAAVLYSRLAVCKY